MKKTRSAIKNSIGVKPFGEDTIRSELSVLCERVDVLFFDEIDSTNLHARRLVAQGKTPPFLVVANSQSAGRGRLGRTFYSPAGSGLYMSLALAAKDVSVVALTTQVSVALCRAIDKVFGKTDARIKWVNDVYLNKKKVAGILAEAIDAPDGSRVVVVGIGVNISTENFPDELKSIAASLGVKNERRSELCAAITNEIFSLALSRDTSYMNEYRERSLVLGQHVNYFVGGEEKVGYVSAILDSGALEIIPPNGKREILNSGEITLRLK